MRHHPRSSVLHGGADDGGDGSLITAAWRLIRCELVGSGVLVGALDLVGLSFCPSLVSVGAGTDDGISGGNLGRYIYQLVELGWFLVPTSSCGLLPLLGVSSFVEPGLLVDEAPNSLFSGDVVAAGHLAQPGRSTITKHIGVSDVLHLVALKTSDVPSSRRWSASRLLLRLLAARTTGRILQRLGCNFPLF